MRILGLILMSPKGWTIYLNLRSVSTPRQEKYAYLSILEQLRNSIPAVSPL